MQTGLIFTYHVLGSIFDNYMRQLREKPSLEGYYEIKHMLDRFNSYGWDISRAKVELSEMENPAVSADILRDVDALRGNPSMNNYDHLLDLFQKGKRKGVEGLDSIEAQMEELRQLAAIGEVDRIFREIFAEPNIDLFWELLAAVEAARSAGVEDMSVGSKKLVELENMALAGSIKDRLASLKQSDEFRSLKDLMDKAHEIGLELNSPQDDSMSEEDKKLFAAL